MSTLLKYISGFLIIQLSLIFNADCIFSQIIPIDKIGDKKGVIIAISFVNQNAKIAFVEDVTSGEVFESEPTSIMNLNVGATAIYHLTNGITNSNGQPGGNSNGQSNGNGQGSGNSNGQGNSNANNLGFQVRCVIEAIIAGG
ncbi:hypothetical protein JYT51_01325 [Candidatus Amoebophilus asiaticus]|nr:hypothetical protein [Candidatus Amoebophilus asiaticus]